MNEKVSCVCFIGFGRGEPVEAGPRGLPGAHSSAQQGPRMGTESLSRYPCCGCHSYLFVSVNLILFSYDLTKESGLAFVLCHEPCVQVSKILYWTSCRAVKCQWLSVYTFNRPMLAYRKITIMYG